MSQRRWWAFVLFFSILKVCAIAADNISGESLHVKAKQTLEINTLTLEAKHNGTSLPLYQHTAKCNSSASHPNSDVAVLNITNDITFEKGSNITVSGNRSLSIQSVTGNIIINSDVRVTCIASCGPAATCLGGYMEGKPECSSNLFPGAGPGWNKRCKVGIDKCIPGGSHGGKGGTFNDDGEIVDSTKPYGTEDFECMHGGSAGFSLVTRCPCFSGGAVEIKAHRNIDIGGSISASAFAPNLSLAFSGCSGGLIRLVAKKVVIHKGASLNVNGAAGGTSYFFANGNPELKGNGGGAGGVVQIMATRGIIRNVTLAKGLSHKCLNSAFNSTNGVLLIKSNKTNTVLNQTSSLVYYKWPNETETAADIDPTLPPLVDLNSVSKQLFQIKELLNNGITQGELGKIIANLHQLINISRGNLTKEELLEFLVIFENYTEIVALLCKEVPLSNIQEIYDKLMNIATSVIAPTNLPNWKDLKQLPNFVNTLERMVLSISNSTNSSSVFQSNTETIVVQSYGFNIEKNQGYTFPLHDELPRNSFITKEDYIFIPKSSLPNIKKGYKLVILFFKDIQDGLAEQSFTDQSQGSKPSSSKVGSMLISCSVHVNGLPITTLMSPASLNFALINTKEEDKTKKAHAQCVFWNTSTNSWDNEGLSVKDFNSSSRAVCTTIHFTSFAVLMQHTAIPVTKAEELSLLLITYIGCGISTASLLIAFIVFVSIEALSSERHRIHLNLVIALLLAQILFLSGITATSNETVCKVIAGTLHYLYMASFTWMLIEGVHLYLKVVKVFGIENVKIRQYCILGWGVPALIVAAAAIIKPYGYGTKYVCWLSLEDGFVWAFIGPVLAIIAVNCFILAAVIKTVVASASTVKNSEHAHIKAGIKGALVLMPLMGITWVFGLLAVNRDSLVFQYVFSIANSLQGTLIFLMHIVFNNEVRQAFKRQREKKQLSKESGDYNASVSNSHESDRKTWGKSTSSNSLTGFGRIKARLSMSVMPRTSRVVNVQPIKSADDEDVQVNRKFYHHKPSNELSSSLHCPSGIESDSKPPFHSPLNSARNTGTRF